MSNAEVGRHIELESHGVRELTEDVVRLGDLEIKCSSQSRRPIPETVADISSAAVPVRL